MAKLNSEEQQSNLVKSRRNWRMFMTAYLVLQILLFVFAFVQNPTIVLLMLMLVFVGIIALVWKQEIENMMKRN